MNKPITTPTYTYTNPHPTGKKSLSDCVYRAVSIATGKDWLTVYDELTALGRELMAPPNDKATYATYLDKIGTRIDVTKPGGSKLTGNDVAKLNPGKVYVIRMANHLAAVKGGKVRDTWNCGYKTAYIIWEIKK